VHIAFKILAEETVAVISLFGLIPNNILTLNARKFKIIDVAGGGGSSIVYLAQSVDDESGGYVMIKELYPHNCGIQRVTIEPEIGVLKIDPKYQDKFIKIKNRAILESGTAKILRNDRSNATEDSDGSSSSVSNNPWFLEYSDPIEANGTLYTIIETKSGKTLKSLIDTNRDFFNDKGFVFICELMLKILDALEHVHLKGYLHLDIAPDNIFIPEYKKGFIEIIHVHTIDFNSALLKGTEPEGWISSYKEGYTAPEVEDSRTEIVDLNEATDLYSVTAVFFELLVGRKLKGSDRGSFSSWKLTRKSGMLEGATNLLIAATNRFLLKGIEKTRDLRFQNVAEMQEELRKLIRMSERKILRNTQKFNPAYGHFTGMEEYLMQLANALDAGNYVYIEGIGGIGKTELAKKYAEENRNKYDIIQLITYDGSLLSTIARELKFHNYDEDTYAVEYKKALQDTIINDSELDEKINKKLFLDKLGILEEHNEKILIIIDNYNVASDDDFDLFISGIHKVIFTSRIEHNAKKERKVVISGISDEENVLALFGTYYGERKITKEDEPVIIEIGKWALGHTMTIELVAAALSANDDRIESMFERLRDGITDIGAYAEIDKQELTVSERELTVSAHIKKLFDISGVLSNAKYEFIMVNMAIVPLEGMLKSVFYDWALLDWYKNNKNEADHDINTLKKHRWLQISMDDVTEKHTLSLHALVSDIINAELKPDSNKCASLLAAMIGYSEDCKRKTYIEQHNGISLIEQACARISDDTEITGKLYRCMALLNDSLARYDISIKWYTKALNTIRRALGEEHPLTANIYNDMASVYSRCGFYDEALELHEIALAIRLRLFGTQHRAVATSYNNIASIHNKMGNPDEALVWLEKDLAICESSPVTDDPEIASTYISMGNSMCIKGYYDKALELYTKAFDIRRLIFGSVSPEISVVLNNMALALCSLKEYDKALELYAQDHSIILKVFGPDSPALATNYINVGLLDYHQGDYNSTLEWLEKAFPIREKALGLRHPDTGSLCDFIAKVYDMVGKHEKAQEYRDRIG
jgi:tetratricopeptide (TPR) repeat protein/serine/threonine protein kinase